MRIRFCSLLMLLALIIGIAPSVALAWGNGTGDPNAFGTHDWILYEAIKIAQPSWLDTQTALLATDDPDSLYGPADKVNHMYLQTGVYRGGPQAIDETYRAVVAAYWAGDYETASRLFGVLSHYYSDLCVPFHTTGGITTDAALHLEYELEVSRMLDQPDAHPEWIAPWGISAVDDVRIRAIEAANASRATYYPFATNYEYFGFNYLVESVTKANLSRAVHDLANILLAVPDGGGMSSRIGVTTRVSQQYPAIDRPISVYATCLDERKMPAEGIRVDFTWNYPSGEQTVTVYSDSNGVAKATSSPELYQLGSPSSVRATLPSALVSTGSSTSWFTPTDTIGYMNTTISSPYPSWGDQETAEVVCLNKTGQPVGGLPVTFSWHYKTTTSVKTVTTDAQGIARMTRTVASATKFHKVQVEAQVQAAGVVRTASAYFTPADNIASIEATMTDHEPRQNGHTTAITTLKDSLGRPIAGAPVTFVWNYRSKKVTKVATTDSSGVARSYREVGTATRGYVIYVTSSARSGGSTKSASTWFTPR